VRYHPPTKAIPLVAPWNSSQGSRAFNHRNGPSPGKPSRPTESRFPSFKKKGDVCLFDRTTLHHFQNRTTRQSIVTRTPAQYQEAKRAAASPWAERKTRKKMLVSELRAIWQKQLTIFWIFGIRRGFPDVTRVS